MTTPNNKYPMKFRGDYYSQIVGFLLIVLSLLVLLGWGLDIEMLQSFLPGKTAMQPNTAVSFMLSGIALWLLISERDNEWKKRFAAICAGMVFLIGLSSLIEYVTGWNFGIGQLLLLVVQNITKTAHPALMAPNTALCFVFTGVAFLLINETILPKYNPIVLGILGFLITVLCTLTILGYFPYIGIGDVWWNPTLMAMNTSFLFILLGIEFIRLAFRQYKIKWIIGKKIRIIFISALMILIFVSIATSNYVIKMVDATQWVAHTQEVLKEIQELSANLIAIQNNTKSYLLSGDKSFSDTILMKTKVTQENLVTLRKLTGITPAYNNN